MKQEVWVLNFYEEHFELYDSKEKAVEAVEHNYNLVWDGNTAEGFHKFKESDYAELSISPKEVL